MRKITRTCDLCGSEISDCSTKFVIPVLKESFSGTWKDNITNEEIDLCNNCKKRVTIVKKVPKIIKESGFKLIETENEKTCEWEWCEDFETDQAGWILNCGCWKPYDDELSYFDDEDSKPDTWRYCPRCGTKVINNAD